MSAISVRPTESSRAGRPPYREEPRPGRFARLRLAARCLGTSGIAACGFVAALGWAFAGSLWLRLGSSPPPASALAWRWLAVEGLVAAVTVMGIWLAVPAMDPGDR
ncbi:MAG TPA: hypothetical protein VGM87_09800 [Roseomonas sp.]